MMSGKKSNVKSKALSINMQKQTDAAIRLIASITNRNPNVFRSLSSSQITQMLSVLLKNEEDRKKLLHELNNKHFFSEYLSQEELRKLESHNIKRKRLEHGFPTAERVYEYLKISAALRANAAMIRAMDPTMPFSYNNAINFKIANNNDNQKGNAVGSSK